MFHLFQTIDHVRPSGVPGFGGLMWNAGREKVKAAGAARAGPGWADEGSWCNYYFSAKERYALEKRIDDSNSIDDLAVLHIFGEKHAAPGLLCAAKDQRIPKRDAMEPMQVDGGENIAYFRFRYVEPGEKFNSSLGQHRIELEFACG
jgi:hypothetical protein